MDRRESIADVTWNMPQATETIDSATMWHAILSRQAFLQVSGIAVGAAIATPLVMEYLVPTVASAASDDLRALVRAASIIVVARVQDLVASTLPTILAAANTVVVTVTADLSTLPGLHIPSGSRITVQLLKPGSITVGQTAVFFTTPWVFGSGLAVREVAIHPLTTDPQTLRTQITLAQQANSDQDLQRRLMTADLVVVGAVVQTHEVIPATKLRFGSFDGPDWWVASIAVKSVLRGKISPTPGTISVNFPHNRSYSWSFGPALVVGQEGLFILHRHEGQQLPEVAFRIDGYTALFPLDFQPLNELPRVRRLLTAITS